MKKRFGFEAKAVWLDAHGNIRHRQEWTHNNLMNEGERNIFDAYLRGLNVPTAFWVKLYADTPVETDSLSSLSNEPGGLLGYSPQQITRDATGWPTLGESGGDAEIISRELTFRATSGTWPAVTHAVLATSSDSSGKLVDATALDQTQQLASGEQIILTYRPVLQ